jgi:hypothetical protein
VASLEQRIDALEVGAGGPPIVMHFVASMPDPDRPGVTKYTLTVDDVTYVSHEGEDEGAFVGRMNETVQASPARMRGQVRLVLYEADRHS